MMVLPTWLWHDPEPARRRRRAIEQARAELVRKGADPRSQRLTEKATRLVDRRIDRAYRRKRTVPRGVIA